MKAIKNVKAQKASIKEELLPIAWHPDGVTGWCMSEYETRLWKQQIVVLKLSNTKITTLRYILIPSDPGRLNKMCDLFRNVSLYLIQKTCDKAVNINPYFLEIFPDRYKTQEVCGKVVEKYPCSLKYVSDHFKTQDMCNEAVE